MTAFNSKAARAKRPCPIWVDAFQRDTQHLEADEIGAYFLILMAMWTRESCDFPDDDNRLARVSRVSSRLWKSRIGPVLREFLTADSGVVFSKRLRQEATYVERQVKQQSDRKTGEKSDNHLNNNEPGSTADMSADATAAPSFLQPNNPTLDGGGSSAGAHEPQGLALRERVLAAMGVGPDGVIGPSRFIGGAGDMSELRRWLDLPNLTPDVICAEVTRIISGNPSKRNPTVSIHFASMTVTEITDRAHKLMQEGTALALLANALTEFEEATGRKLFVSEADQGTQYVGRAGPEIEFSRTIRDHGPEVVCDQQKASSLPDTGLTVSRLAVRVDTPAEHVAETASVQEPIKNAAPAIAKPVPPKPTRAQEPVKKPAPRPFAAPAAAKAQTTDRPWGALNLPERAIVKHLEKLAPAFTPAEDLTIAELLISGNKIEAVALQLEVQASMALARWKAFLCGEVLGENGKPSMDGQQRLLAALRYRKDTAA